MSFKMATDMLEFIKFVVQLLDLAEKEGRRKFEQMQAYISFGPE